MVVGVGAGDGRPPSSLFVSDNTVDWPPFKVAGGVNNNMAGSVIAGSGGLRVSNQPFGGGGPLDSPAGSVLLGPREDDMEVGDNSILDHYHEPFFAAGTDCFAKSAAMDIAGEGQLAFCDTNNELCMEEAPGGRPAAAALRSGAVPYVGQADISATRECTQGVRVNAAMKAAGAGLGFSETVHHGFARQGKANAWVKPTVVALPQ